MRFVLVALLGLVFASVSVAQTLPQGNPLPGSQPPSQTQAPVTRNTPGIGTRFYFDQYNQMLAGAPQNVVVRLNAGAHLDGDGQADLTLEQSQGATGLFSRLVAPAFPGVAITPQIGQVDASATSPTRAACLDVLRGLPGGQSRLLVSSHNAPRYYCVRTTSGLYGRMTLLTSTGERVDELSARLELWR